MAHQKVARRASFIRQPQRRTLCLHERHQFVTKIPPARTFVECGSIDQIDSFQEFVASQGRLHVRRPFSVTVTTSGDGKVRSILHTTFDSHAVNAVPRITEWKQQPREHNALMSRIVQVPASVVAVLRDGDGPNAILRANMHVLPSLGNRASLHEHGFRGVRRRTARRINFKSALRRLIIPNKANSA